MTTVSLPYVACEVCGARCGSPDINYPNIECSAELLETLRRLPEHVSVDQFEEIRRQVPVGDPHLWRLRPWAKLGVQRFSMDAPPPDFLLDRNCSLISDKALRILEREGVRVYTGEVEIRCPKKPLMGWRAAVFPELRILTDRSKIDLGVTECSRCGEITLKKPIDAKALFQGHSDHELVTELWPSGLGLARLRESGWRVPSPQFIDVWNKHKLTGIRFVPIGKWA